MTDPLSRLPLFASDDEIAIAIVGKKRASQWKRGALILLEARGFPRVDPLHGGRPVPMVRKWYERYMGMHLSYIPISLEDHKEDPGSWTRRKRDRKPQLGLDARSQKVLMYMVAHPDAKTHVTIPNAGVITMERLAEKGVVVAGATDRDGDIQWDVTDAGRDEAKRIIWFYGGKTED